MLRGIWESSSNSFALELWKYVLCPRNFVSPEFRRNFAQPLMLPYNQIIEPGHEHFLAWQCSILELQYVAIKLVVAANDVPFRAQGPLSGGVLFDPCSNSARLNSQRNLSLQFVLGYALLNRFLGCNSCSHRRTSIFYSADFIAASHASRFSSVRSLRVSTIFSNALAATASFLYDSVGNLKATV